jgi:hypothetical protein
MERPVLRTNDDARVEVTTGNEVDSQVRTVAFLVTDDTGNLDLGGLVTH